MKKYENYVTSDCDKIWMNYWHWLLYVLETKVLIEYHVTDIT